MTIVFLTFHGLSHFNASFRIARLLAKEHAVVFAGHPAFRGYVEAQGFGYYALESLPFGLGFEEWVNEQDKKGNIWIRSLRDRWSQKLFKQRELELKKLLNSLRPARIFIDAQQATDFVVLYPHARQDHIGLSILHTFLPQVLRKGYPPGNSLTNPEHRVSVSLSRAKFRIHRAVRTAGSVVRYAGKTNRTMVIDAMKANGTPLSFLSKSIAHLSVHISGTDELILAPEEFDFSSAARSAHEHYIGFMPDLTRQEKDSVSIVRLFNEFKQTGEPLVYLSFGTVRSGDQKRLTKFMRKFSEAVAHQPFIVAISTMAMGDYPPRHLPSNVHLFNPAPQLALLRRASLFVTHGGFNSIKESIYAGVPMLVYPRDSRMDQNGNAARISFHRLGLHGDINRDSAADILRKMQELLGDPQYRKRVEEFRAIDERYTDERFLGLVAQMRGLE
jgi:zeaxanthin glucosyltransferase